MITNNIGLILYSLLNGKKIGEDAEGNKFYIHKKNKKKKWVLYKKQVDPTSLEVKWQIWLTQSQTNQRLIYDNEKFKWQKNKEANLTGTPKSYHPGSKINKKEVAIRKQNKNSIWKPEK